MGPASSGDYEQASREQASREQGGAMGALGREVGRRSVERLGSGLTRIVEESSALYRWMLTMLVLLNAAAIYTAISARDAMGPDMFAQLVLLFFAGLMAALLAALAGMALTLPVAGSIRRAITHWTDVSLTGALSDEALASARHVRLIGIIWLSVISAIAFVSLLLFLMGAAIMAQQFGIIRAPAREAPALEATITDAPDNAAQALPEPQANAATALPPAARATSPAPRAAEPQRPAPRQSAPTRPAPTRPAAATQQRPAPVPTPRSSTSPSTPPVAQPAPVRTPAPTVVPSSPPVIVVPPAAPSAASPD